VKTYRFVIDAHVEDDFVIPSFAELAKDLSGSAGKAATLVSVQQMPEFTDQPKAQVFYAVGLDARR